MKRFHVERSKYGSFTIGIRSRDDDDRAGFAHIRLFGWWMQFNTNIIPPIERWHDLTNKIGHTGYKWLKPDRDGRYGYNQLIVREYSFAMFDGAINVHYGEQENGGTEKSWYYPLPFMQWKFWRHSFYHLNGELYAHATNYGHNGSFEKDGKLRTTVPKAYFAFKDYDGEEIKVACYIEEREWRRGTKWASWLRYLFAPKLRRSLNLEFSNQVGERKRSWKGGTLGHSCELRGKERPSSAFTRYCYHNKLTFIGECEPWERPVWSMPDATQAEGRTAR